MKYIHRLDSLIARMEEWLLIFIVIFMVSFAFLQVLLRNIFSEGILGGDIVLRQLVLWVGFIGASLATRGNKHINIDVFSRFLKGRLKIFAELLVRVFSLIVTYFLTQASISFVLMEKEFGTTLFGSVQSWYFQIIIPIGFILITFRFLLQAIEKALQLVSSPETAK